MNFRANFSSKKKMAMNFEVNTQASSYYGKIKKKIKSQMKIIAFACDLDCARTVMANFEGPSSAPKTLRTNSGLGRQVAGMSSPFHCSFRCGQFALIISSDAAAFRNRSRTVRDASNLLKCPG